MLAVMLQEPRVTSQELAAMFSVSVRTVKRDIASLTAAGRIAYIGTAKTGHWQVLG
ncbi:helix-turn-helix domain-containing protein [Peptococcus simiae]|uniref:helix-turn-helix domain-containing protein n=1 Tax=Peptococcus simiae TaxID=1643805 RepID=UPI00397FA33B